MRYRVPVLTLGLAALAAVAAVAQSRLTARDLIGKSASSLDSRLGKPRSVGKQARFREYELSTGGVFVGFRNGTSRSLVMTFKIPFSKPEDALAAVDVKVRGKKTVRSLVGERLWRDVGGYRYVAARSSDGRLWDSIEVSNEPRN